jgi:hypothetical protein
MLRRRKRYFEETAPWIHRGKPSQNFSFEMAGIDALHE